jgi:lysine 2,3-aminomutase
METEISSNKNDWKWQLKNSITTLEQLKQIIELSEEELEIFNKNINLPFKITPYYSQLLKYPEIRKTVIPSIFELNKYDYEYNDPLNEDKYKVTKNLIHKYPDRVLLLSNTNCSVNCRFCTRSRLVDKENYTLKDFEESFEYIKQNTQIRDVILSGGDFLMNSNKTIIYILDRLKKIEHVEIIRIGTKIPIVLPQRIDNELLSILDDYKPLYMSIHCTHPKEITNEVKKACNRLADIGIVLRSQTVLLKDVNDNLETIKTLMHELLKIRVSPYYIYSLDEIQGTEHFKVPVKKGIEIIKGLIGNTSGFAIPQFIIDTSIGKIPINPCFYKEENGYVVLQNYKGEEVRYKDI